MQLTVLGKLVDTGKRWNKVSDNSRQRPDFGGKVIWLHRTVFRFLTFGFGWIWLCHNDIVISEIANNIKESVKLLSFQRQVGAVGVYRWRMVEKQRPRLFPPHPTSLEPSGWSLCFVSSSHFAHCFSELVLQQLLTLLCPCVRTQWLPAICSFPAGSLWLPRQSRKFWKPARLRQPVGLGLNAAINLASDLECVMERPCISPVTWD